MTDVLVTGGSGFIGSATAWYLAERGYEVKTLDMVPQPESLRDLDIPHQICDLRAYDALRESLDDVELVIHAAIVQIPRINVERRTGFEVNVLATENLCRIVDSQSIRGMILAGSWHVIGESELRGVVTEGFGYRPDKVEERASLYALSKIAQELIVRLYGEVSEQVFGILRLGTVLGEGMPPDTAASIFIEQALRGQDLTPYRHSLHRPIAYVSIRDVLKGFHRFAKKILSGASAVGGGSLGNIANLLHPEPVTILELAEIVRDAVRKVSEDELNPRIRVVDQGLSVIFDEDDKKRVRFDVSRSKELLGLEDFTPPAEEIEAIVRSKFAAAN